MRHNSIILASLFLMALLFILSLLAFKFLISERYQGQMFAASLLQVVTSPTTIAANSVSNSPSTNQFDLGPTINTVITTIGVIVAAIIGVIGASIANDFRRNRKGAEKEQEKTTSDNKSKTSREYADDYR